MQFRDEEEFALQLDGEEDPALLRDRFYLQPGVIYMDGNSLGLMSRDAEKELLRGLRQWRELGIRGWLEAEPPWFHLAEELGRRQAEMMGADADEVVSAASTTVNLHALVSSFYCPEEGREGILADELNFPSDLYALTSQLRMRGVDPGRHLRLVRSRDGRFLEEDDIIEAMTPDVQLAVLPSVLYRSGQLLDMRRLTREAHDRGITIGFDCSHSAGVVPHRLSEWGVDFAFWCSYKYLNSGPGGIASLYVNRRHFRRRRGLAGWWGCDKSSQFDMKSEFEPARGAGGWQIGTVSVFSALPLLGSLRLLGEAGIERVRARSLRLTSYMIYLVDQLLCAPPYDCALGTPREEKRRGGHVAVKHPEALRIVQALKARGVVPDYRPPDVIRLAPVALYNTYHEVHTAVRHIRQIIAQREYEHYSTQRQPVS
ncbi:MAG: kynureninase [Bacillota bacterium]